MEKEYNEIKRVGYLYTSDDFYPVPSQTLSSKVLLTDSQKKNFLLIYAIIIIQFYIKSFNLGNIDKGLQHP